jgi:RNA polymerase-associated protein CTR9
MNVSGDSLVYHAGMKFSTRDVDNDQWIDGNCAEMHSGAWWYSGCDTR